MTDKVNYIKMLADKRKARQQKKNDKCHGNLKIGENVTRYDLMRQSIATPDFSRHSKSVKQMIMIKKHVLEQEEFEKDQKQRIYNKAIEVVNNEIYDKMAMRNASALHQINKYKLMATSMSQDKGITL